MCNPLATLHDQARSLSVETIMFVQKCNIIIIYRDYYYYLGLTANICKNKNKKVCARGNVKGYHDMYIGSMPMSF
jgi:hypothetical protein